MSEGYAQPSGGGFSSPSGAVLDYAKDVLAKPESKIRLLTVLFSIIVFGAISANGYTLGHCVVNDSTACNYAITIGVMAFLDAIFVLAAEVAILAWRREDLTDKLLLWDLVCSVATTFLYFVGFCFMANQYGRVDRKALSTKQKNAVQGAIAFSFFSIFAWACLAFMAFRTKNRTPGYNDLGESTQRNSSTGSGLAHAHEDSPYQEAPGSSNEKPVY